MKLTKARRAKIPTSKFAGPDRSFPVENKAHAKAALLDVGNSNISPSAKAKVRSKAKSLLSDFQ